MMTPNEFEKKLKMIDLEPILFSLVRATDGPQWSLEKARTAEKWYRRFHTLYFRHPTAILVPTKLIDTFWHHHILDTQKYFDDCMVLHGHVLHHFPYLGVRDHQDKILLEQSFKETIRLFLKEFGESADQVFASDGAGVICGGGGGGGGSDCSRGNHPLLSDHLRPNLGLAT
jgi:hypothetical protein